MKRSFPLALVLALATIGAGAESASSVELLRAEPGFREIGELPEPLPLEGFLRASLLASGLGGERLPAYEKRINGLLEELASSVIHIEGEGERAEAALRFLHERVLGTYREDATGLDQILDSGRFNCVSSALLYMMALKRLGIAVGGVRTRDHAFCYVSVGGKDVDVETTNPQGYDPGTKKEFTDSFGKVTGFAYVPPGAYGGRERIGERTMIGLVLSNRAAALERSGRYAEALRLGADMDAANPGRESRAFLLDRINNLVSELTRRRDFDGAGALVAAASSALDGEARLLELERLVSYNLAASLAGSGDWGGALDAAETLVRSGGGGSDLSRLVETALGNLVAQRLQKEDFAGARAAIESRRSLSGERLYATLRSRIGEAELVAAVKRLPFREAVAAVGALATEGAVDPRRASEALVVLYGNEANRIGSSGDWLAAAALAEQGAARAQGDGNLARAAAAFRRNFVVEAHNRFVALFNERSLERARKTVEAALASMPGDATLLEDLALVNRTLLH